MTASPRNTAPLTAARAGLPIVETTVGALLRHAGEDATELPAGRCRCSTSAARCSTPWARCGCARRTARCPSTRLSCWN